MKDKFKMKRREFLHFLTGLGAAATLPFFSSCNLILDENYNPSVTSAWVPKNEFNDSYDTFKKVVESATDFSWLLPGDSVFIKLSIESFYPYPATTDPQILTHMVRLLKEKGAGQIYAGDQSGIEHVFHLENDSQTRNGISYTSFNANSVIQLVFKLLKTSNIKWGASRECCKRSGLLDVLYANNVTPVFFEEQGYRAYKKIRPSFGSSWNIPIYIADVVDRVDHIINLPRVANHSMAGATLGMMTSIGYLRNDSRISMYINKKKFHERYVETNFIDEIESKVRLTVTSGMKLITQSGPDVGKVMAPDMGIVFASEDILAHDLLALAWLEVNRGAAEIDIYSYPAPQYYMYKKGSPQSMTWDQINRHNDADIENYMKKLMKVSSPG